MIRPTQLSQLLLPEVGLLGFRMIEVTYGYVISKLFSNIWKKKLLACCRWSSL